MSYALQNQFSSVRVDFPNDGIAVQVENAKLSYVF